MKSKQLLSRLCLLVGISLAACQPAPVVMPTVATLQCSQPGTVELLQAESPTRGYDYRFALYLPPCYGLDTGRRYPVLYLVPGRGSAPGAWMGAGVNTIADDLILSGRIPPVIIVETENTDSDPMAEAIFNDLLPYIDSHYRVRADRQHRAVAGGSLGGIAAYRLAFQHPDYFSSAGVFGSGLVAGEEPQVTEWLGAMTPGNKPRVFFNCGEGDGFMLDRALVLIDMLNAAGVENTSIVSEGDHSYAYWASNFAAYLQWAAEDWEP